MSDQSTRDVELKILEEVGLLDARDYSAWLLLYADPCTYWVPAGPRPFDSRKSLSIVYDDREALSQRVERLKGRFAYSQTPPSITLRSVSNLVVTCEGDPEAARAECAYVIFELRNHQSRTYPAHCRYALVRDGASWKISEKIVELLHADEPLEEIGYIL